MEYKNNLLIVDEVIVDPRLPYGLVVKIENNVYMLKINTNRPISESNLRTYKSPIDKSWRRFTHDYEYLMHGMIPRSGFIVNVGREITESEFLNLLAEYSINPDNDVSAEFQDTIGAIYGEYAKTIISKQVKVPNNKAIELEQKLKDMGIQAGNTAPGRVNIRWGGKRPGAGAPKQAPPDATRRTFLLTDDEHKKVKELINKMRAAE